MWIFTKHGFFSVVAVRGLKATVMVRARAREDIDAFAKHYVPGPYANVVESAPEADYPYRLVMPRQTFTEAMALATEDIDYSNFKAEVDRRQGRARHDIYTEIWAIMNGLEEKLRRKTANLTTVANLLSAGRERRRRR